METGYLWLFHCFKYWILMFLVPKLFESSMNAHAGFGTLWERGSLKDGPLWKILYKPIQPREIIKKSRHPDTISSNVGNRIIPSSSWSSFNYRTTEVALVMLQCSISRRRGHSGQSRIMTNNPFRWTMARDKSWYIGWYPEKFILGPMNARNSLTILPTQWTWDPHWWCCSRNLQKKRLRTATMLLRFPGCNEQPCQIDS